MKTNKIQIIIEADVTSDLQSTYFLNKVIEDIWFRANYKKPIIAGVGKNYKWEIKKI